jgi:hypothetical protein
MLVRRRNHHSVILTGRNPERLKQAALELDAPRIVAFDANDPAFLQSFFQDLPTPIDHVMVTALIDVISAIGPI